MDKFNELYEKNKILDQKFFDKFYFEGAKLYEKNCLELIVELCEFCNETKCFKYWTVKKPKRDEMLEEYADCITMMLYMFNEYNIEKIDIVTIDISDDILMCFNELIKMSTRLMIRDNINNLFLKEMFTYLLHIGKLLDISYDEVLDACYKKIIKNEERLQSNY